MKLILAFALLTISIILPSAYATSASIVVNDVAHNVEYTATGLEVDGLEADTATAALSVLITTTEAEGTLQITLERSFFDSSTDGVDDDFLVLLDGGQDVTPVEEKTDTARTLTIIVPSGTNSVDIVSLGTTNFGTGEPTPVEEPAPIEEPVPVEEPAPVEEPVPIEEPTIECGPGTVFDSQTNTCVLVTPEPVVETPTEEPPTTSVDETPVQECGPGTILQDGQCVLDQTCGPGTILQDGQCVLDTVAPAPTVSRSEGTQFIVAIVAGFIIAIIIVMILWAIGRAGRAKN